MKERCIAVQAGKQWVEEVAGGDRVLVRNGPDYVRGSAVAEVVVEALAEVLAKLRAGVTIEYAIAEVCASFAQVPTTAEGEKA